MFSWDMNYKNNFFKGINNIFYLPITFNNLLKACFSNNK